MVLDAWRRRQRDRTTRAHVWLDGRDVTYDCVYADVRRGMVRLYARDAQGNYMVRDGRLVTTELRGRVTVRYRDRKGIEA